MHPVKAILFDLDDTLWPIMPVIERAENLLFDWLTRHTPAVAESFSIESLRQRRQELMPTDPIYQLDMRALRRAGLLEAFAAAGENLALVDHAMEVFSHARNEVTPFSDVLPALGRLRGQVLLGSVSNGVADLEAIGMAHFFQVSVAAHHYGCAKPNATIFHAGCEALRVAPQEAVYVGDDPVLDIDGAQKAGLRAVWVNRSGLQPAQALPPYIRPDAVCSTLYELEQWLQKNAVKL